MSSAITLASSTSWTSPGAGTTGGYDGKSDTLRTFTVFMAGLAIVSMPISFKRRSTHHLITRAQADAGHIQYNACELIIMIFLTFSRFRGMYFWSLLIAATGIIPNALGLMLKFMNVTASGNVKWLSIILVHHRLVAYDHRTITGPVVEATPYRQREER
ncbi:hypothetical protein DOTSEDRAFT_28600 [Dothistroma septosporum NZE10]|uniref:DUF7703 domain-containing protein n=1 Tax=Dothistroma septosporum (strain NZE10 / CBS 128990) TaxID=675120 RepID=M2YKF3_DOTSN|nr:hypothetical protein DOTSEDRAFT_28600 [Dothistroma septosporum NZE10]